ncbi:DUF4179 domain-containing protein [Brevibacterium sp. JNUCC-42]|nr:DUF4179 domain-containing protein [Brevibacterium sp. JNUCC-42]
MTCVKSSQLQDYLEDKLSPVESRQLEAHVSRCSQCQVLLEAQLDSFEEPVIEMGLTAPLPEPFALEMEHHFGRNRHSKFRNKSIKPMNWKTRSVDILKKMTLAVAGLAVAVSLGTFVSPAFADYVKSLFISEQNSDQGMINAAQQGFVQQVDKKVTDQNITVELKEILADSMRIAAILDAKDKDGKKIDHLSRHLEETLLDPAGKDLTEEISNFNRTDYNGVTSIHRELTDLFNDTNPIPDSLTLQLKINQIGDVKGKWEFSVPIDMKKAKAATQTVRLNKTYTSPEGFVLDFEKIELSPSATRIAVNSKVTKETEEKLKKMIKENGLKDYSDGRKDEDSSIPYRAADAIRNAAYAYEILDETGSVVAAYDALWYLGEDISLEKNVINGTSGQGQADGSLRLWNTFIPLKDKKSLTIKLRRVYNNVISPFSAKVKPMELAKNPVTQKDSLGNTFTFKNFSFEASKEVTPPTRFVFGESKIEFEGTLAKDIVTTEVWYALDENGKEYSVHFKGRKYKKDQNGLIQVKGLLCVAGLEQQPKKLTLHYKIAQKQNTDIDWKIDIPVTK